MYMMYKVTLTLTEERYETGHNANASVSHGAKCS